MISKSFQTTPVAANYCAVYYKNDLQTRLEWHSVKNYGPCHLQAPSLKNEIFDPLLKFVALE